MALLARAEDTYETSICVTWKRSLPALNEDFCWDNDPQSVSRLGTRNRVWQRWDVLMHSGVAGQGQSLHDISFDVCLEVGNNQANKSTYFFHSRRVILRFHH